MPALQPYTFIIVDYLVVLRKPIIMENSNLLDLITGGVAITILLSGMLMMFTTIFTTKKNGK
jgi:hypothetical protein